jgi:predicted GH43/DUF377 family glycosyl hydrolase
MIAIMGSRTQALRRNYRRDIIRRWEGNPCIRIQELPFPALDICNAGVVKLDGKYILLLTVVSLDGRERVYRAESVDGYYFNVEKEPVLAPSPPGEEPFHTYEQNGVEDSRITLLEGKHYVSYTAGSPLGLRLALAQTKDFREFKRMALISEPDTKHGCLFPEKIGGRYARLERPREGGSIWLSFSDDLVYWGGMKRVMGPRHGFWDFHRVGPGTPPVRVDEGWLIIYYGVKSTSAGPLFRLGSAILDAENPARVIGRADVPVLSPQERYERVGDTNNLVFTCGAVLEDDGTFRLYYGASDSCICMGTAPVKSIVDRCLGRNGHGG